MQPKFCIRCGSPLIEGDSFCRKCGTRISMPGAVPQQGPAYESSKAKIPGYKEIKARFTGSAETGEPEKKEDPEGTMLLGGPGSMSGSFGGMGSKRKAELRLSFEELLRGCSKVVDFGTGTRYELEIPSGLSPGDRILVEDTGIIDNDTGMGCEIELTLAID